MSLSIFLSMETSFPNVLFKNPSPHCLKNETFLSSQPNTPMLPYHSSPSLIGFHCPLVVIFFASWNLSHPYAIFPIVSSPSSIILIVVLIAWSSFSSSYHHLLSPFQLSHHCSHHFIFFPSSYHLVIITVFRSSHC